MTTDEYSVSDEPSGTPKKIRIIVVGAGASGLNFAREVYQNIPSADLVLYDKNPSIGGTWYENKYPGVACDIPAVSYQFSWAPSSEWPSYYSPGADILKYLKTVAKNHGLDKDVQLNSKLTSAVWDEETKRWNVIVQRTDDPSVTFTDSAEILINATGVFNKWKWPDIKGLESFKGPTLHTSNWESSLSLKGKRVGVIGSGASAVQIVPNILSEVKSVTQFVRSKFWVTAGFAQKFAGPGGDNWKYTPEQIEVFKNDPKKYLAYRKSIESEINQRFSIILRGSEAQQQAREYAENEMRRKLSNKPEIADKIIPTEFGVGCRRPTPGNGYLEALNSDKADLVFNDIREINETGLVTKDGSQYDFDVLICATGFDLSWIPQFTLVGRNGNDIRQVWKEKQETYLSATVPSFPNYFILLGPNGAHAHGGLWQISEAVAKYAVQIIKRVATESVTSFEPKQEAVDDFKIHRRSFLERTVWNDPCRSWFKKGNGVEDLILWPGSRIHFFEILLKPRLEDYNLTHDKNNRFSYLGNGFHVREFDNRDLSWYLGLLDGKDEEPEFNEETILEFLVNS